MITVFIGTYNRLETLKATVESYRCQWELHELVIVDNGTDNIKCVEYLDQLEQTNAVKKIYRLPGCMSMDEATDNFNVAIRDQYENGDAGEWFAISEADVCFDGSSSYAFEAYIELAKATGRVVGPHLRVDLLIPRGYPLRSRVLACETYMLYRRDMEPQFWKWDTSYHNICQIDTTFHLFPRRRRFDRLHMDPIRVGPPYDAKHLDWYLDIHKPNQENSIYIADQRTVGSWGKAWIRDFWFTYQQNPERAFANLHIQPSTDDLNNAAFMLAWCYQYGEGVEADREKSEMWLRAAIPPHYDRYWQHEKDWLDFIYENDFSALGWT